MRSRSRSPHHRRERVSNRPKDYGRDRGKERSTRREVDRVDRPDRGVDRPRYRSRSRSPLPPARRRHSRSRSPVLRRRIRSPTRTPPRDRSRSTDQDKKDAEARPQISDADLVGKTDDEIEMMKLMGFAGFDSTKNKHVSGNTGFAVNIIHKRKYRQYMNRKGGFNRPLDFVA